MPQLCIQFEDGLKPKHVADDKFINQIVPRIFIYSSINSIFKQKGLPCLKMQMVHLMN